MPMVYIPNKTDAFVCLSISTGMFVVSVVTVSLFSRSVGVAQCFHEKVGGWFGFGVYACAPSAAVWLLCRTVWHCGRSRRASGVHVWYVLLSM